ncbi:MAG: response regulator transcription factor [Candidatus Gracilibacteria bacterium]|nr:response regulator transcription factor [Candidatus Gracilibacteria bacterium]
MNFLIIEDDIFLASKLKYLFDKRQDINLVKVINNYLEFLDELSTIDIYDIILLDINLGNESKSGIDIIEIVRKKNLYVPIIIVSGIDDISNIRDLFNLGASDYIIKPFRFEELEIRVLKWFKNRFLKIENFNNKYFLYNGLLYDIEINEFYFNGKNIRLTKKNKYLLYIFLVNSEKFLSLNYIEDKIFGNYDSFKEKNIRIYIFRLRVILRDFGIDSWIKNIRGEGYIFKKD